MPAAARSVRAQRERLGLSAADFGNAEMLPFIEKYMRSGSMDAKARIALMRLMQDFIATEFGGRHQQYEKFYGGASFLVKQNVYRNYDFKRATAMVDAALNATPSAPEAVMPNDTDSVDEP